VHLLVYKASSKPVWNSKTFVTKKAGILLRYISKNLIKMVHMEVLLKIRAGDSLATFFRKKKGGKWAFRAICQSVRYPGREIVMEILGKLKQGVR
jgi:phage pi2 protein 07